MKCLRKTIYAANVAKDAKDEECYEIWDPKPDCTLAPHCVRCSAGDDPLRGSSNDEIGGPGRIRISSPSGDLQATIVLKEKWARKDSNIIPFWGPSSNNCIKGKMGPEGFEPSTKRIKALFQLGYKINLSN